MLVDAGADVEIKDNYGDTPLVFASKNGLLGVVEVLAAHCSKSDVGGIAH